jgi:hypothetical protein
MAICHWLTQLSSTAPKPCQLESQPPPEYVGDMTFRMSLLALLAAALAFCVPSRADSDGCFCTSRGYLAYELRGAITPGGAGHVLRVVRFESRRGIYVAGEVVLQDFQVHHMACTEDRVEISGWAEMFKRYVIDVGEKQEVHILDYIEGPMQRFDASKEGPEPPQLGYGQTRTFPLESFDSIHEYELRRSRSEKPVTVRIQTRVRIIGMLQSKLRY